MLARVASNLYWLGRYLQRVEITARLIRTQTNLLMDLPDVDSEASWLSLVEATGGEKIFSKHGVASNERNVCCFLISDTTNSGSMVNDLQAISTNLRACRDCLTTDLYELIKYLCGYSTMLTDQSEDTIARQAILRKIEIQSHAIAGAMSTTISCDNSYWFLRAGNFLERADMTSRILDVRIASLLPSDAKNSLVSFESIQWSSVLRIFSAFQIYMKYVRKPVVGPYVLPFLLQNRQFPNTINYCLEQLARCFRLIGPGYQEIATTTTGAADAQGSDSIAKLDDLIAAIQRTDFHSLAKNKQQLHDYMEQLQEALTHINEEIASRYFLATEVEGE